MMKKLCRYDVIFIQEQLYCIRKDCVPLGFSFTPVTLVEAITLVILYFLIDNLFKQTHLNRESENMALMVVWFCNVWIMSFSVLILH